MPLVTLVSCIITNSVTFKLSLFAEHELHLAILDRMASTQHATNGRKNPTPSLERHDWPWPVHRGPALRPQMILESMTHRLRNVGKEHKTMVSIYDIKW